MLRIHPWNDLYRSRRNVEPLRDWAGGSLSNRAWQIKEDINLLAGSIGAGGFLESEGMLVYDGSSLVT